MIGNLAAVGLMVPTVGIALSVGSGFVLEVWYLSRARDLVRRGDARTTAPAASPVSAPHRAAEERFEGHRQPRQKD